MDALGALVGDRTAAATAPAAAVAGPAASASTSNAAPAPASTTDAAAGSADAAAPAPELQDALMDFARALMQALRGDDGDKPGRRHGHHHHDHHDHGRRAWGDPAQRIQQLGARLSPVAPVDTPPASPAPAVDSATPQSPATEPTATPAPPPAAAPVLNVTINIVPAQGWRRPVGEGLLEAFGTLQQALGRPASSGESLQSRLASFLRALADKLRQDDAPSPGLATEPGALLNVSA
jgi:hypothetical protein